MIATPEFADLVICILAFAALSYSEMASMIPVSGSAYTYTYATMGEVCRVLFLCMHPLIKIMPSSDKMG